jgi:hypothetical protein
MEKETVNLPDIIDVLGKRPYGMNEYMTEYLEELQQRKEKDEKLAMEEAEQEKTLDETLAEDSEPSDEETKPLDDETKPSDDEKDSDPKKNEK